ncbi:hypothetical protein ACHAWF_006205 [Thalassiosira exigua]
MTPLQLLAAALSLVGCRAFTAGNGGAPRTAPCPPSTSVTALNAAGATVGNLHGQASCFLPLLQNDEDYIAPRIVQIAGAYPGVDTKTYLSLTSEPVAEMGQWNYDFSDPNGSHLGTVALPGMTATYETDDPVVLVADHASMGVQLSEELKDPVDLVVLCDRSRKHFAERKFLVLELEESPGVVTIAAFESKGEMPTGAKVLGHVTLVQIPWLPSMEKKKSGFMEENELF